MSTSQALMALFSTDMRSIGAEPGARQPASAGDGEGFAALLAEQLPAELGAAIQELSPQQLASLEQAALAVGGNTLPGQLQDWLQQLPEEAADPAAEDALAVIGRWMQWVQSSEGMASSVSSTAAAANAPVMAGAEQPGTAQPGAVTLLDGASLEGELDGELVGRSMQGRDQPGADAGRQNLNNLAQAGSQPAAAGNQFGAAGTQQTMQNIQQDMGALLQRNAADPAPTAAALFGKLVEQMESKSGVRGEGSDALEGLERAVGQNNTANAALTARPVAAAMQPTTVPFGHQSWGEAMVEKVMWMSSQNLRSVEIQLDPAELGPLEIQIQSRGQDLQVQFISQNPGVREALEGQMHRLREMFAGQGLEQAEVTVADRSAGEQSRQGEGQLAERSVNQAAARENQTGLEEGASVAQAGERITQSLRGLVDYYV